MSVCELTSLTTLLLSHNKLQQLPLQIGRLQALVSLTIESNALARLPLSLRNLTRLTRFDASDNPDIDLPPPAVTSKGSPAPPTEGGRGLRLNLRVLSRDRGDSVVLDHGALYDQDAATGPLRL